MNTTDRSLFTTTKAARQLRGLRNFASPGMVRRPGPNSVPPQPTSVLFGVVDDLIRDGGLRIIIRGRRGAGKTMLARTIMVGLRNTPCYRLLGAFERFGDEGLAVEIDAGILPPAEPFLPTEVAIVVENVP